MTAVLAAPDEVAPHEVVRPAPFLPGYRFELTKLLTQWRLRAVLLVCLVAPGGYVAVVSRQASLPTDTVFGRWMHATGWAGSLVVLAFACSWGLPLLTSLVAGDVFAAEDRLGTWRHLLVAVRSARRIFLAKALASLTVILLTVTALCASSIVGGLAAVGGHPLVGLDGHALAPGQAARAVLVAWLCVLAPTVALAAVGLLGSVLLGRSPMGLLLPAVLALAMDLVLMLPVPVALRLSLPTNTFLAWRGLFTAPAHVGALVAGTAVSLVWALAATGLAYRAFVRRDFTNPSYDGPGRRDLATTVLPMVALVALSALVVTAFSPARGSGIDRRKLEASLSTAFAHLYRLQTDELHRPAVTEAELATRASCDKGGDRVVDRGAGNDWRCVVSWRLPGATAQGTATYQLDVTAEGRYVADGDGPKEVNGSFWVHTPSGDAPNPLWQFDGYVDL
ncbi:MAG TPA: ABC transporter permease, partial [Marmoricola sp.]|nr:ABC transporter permease [Marmoricola sp.]